MEEAPVYNQEGKKTGTIKLPAHIFDAKWNPDLVHQVVTSMQSNLRPPVAHTKDRGEVRGGGAKPWRQKGTGRARHGSNRSPIWVGGGVTHGPRNEKDYTKQINKKMRTKALYAVLSQKLRDGEIIFLEDISLGAPKTAEAKKILTALSQQKGFEKLATKKRNALLLALPEKNEAVGRSFSNIGNMTVEEVRNLNPLAILTHTYLVITNPAESVKALEGRYGAKKAAP